LAVENKTEQKPELQKRTTKMHFPHSTAFLQKKADCAKLAKF